MCSRTRRVGGWQEWMGPAENFEVAPFVNTPPSQVVPVRLVALGYKLFSFL